MALEAAQTPSEEHSRRNKLDTMPSSSSARRKIEDNKDVKAKEHQSKQMVKKPYDTDVTRVSTVSGLMGRKRLMFNCLPIMMLWMLPAKLGLSKPSPAG